jgi:hypothetical protein
MRIKTLVRLIALTAVVAWGSALVIARSAPRDSAFRVQSDPHHAAINGLLLTRMHSPMQVLDTETGVLSPLVLPDGDALEWGAFADWLDEQGERQVVGRWSGVERQGSSSVPTGVGLGRFAYPSGRALDRLSEAPLPARAPCWYPGATPRVLFSSLDGELYQCAFGAPGAQEDAASPAARLVPWPDSAAGLQQPRIDFLAWPKARRWDGCLLATVSTVEAPGRYGPWRLWWLRLSADGMSIAAAGPLSTGEPDGGDPWEDFAPSAAVLPNGDCLLAYQRRPAGAKLGDLFVVTVKLDTQTGRPTLHPEEARKVAGGLLAMPAAFSPDRAWVYALQERLGRAPQLCAFPVSAQRS